MTTTITPVIEPENRGPLEFDPQRAPQSPPKDIRARVWDRISGRPAAKAGPPKPRTPLEERQQFVRRARMTKHYVVPNPVQEARIRAQLTITEAEWSRLKELEQKFASIQAHRRAHGPNSERQAERQYRLQVAEAIRNGLPLPADFCAEKVRTERMAVMAGVNAALRELGAEAFELTLDVGVRVLTACLSVGAVAEAEERKLGEAYGVEVQVSAIGNAYKGIAAYFAGYLPDHPSTLHTVSGALPLLAEQLKAK
jgi:hypothetical protein